MITYTGVESGENGHGKARATTGSPFPRVGISMQIQLPWIARSVWMVSLSRNALRHVFFRQSQTTDGGAATASCVMALQPPKGLGPFGVTK